MPLTPMRSKGVGMPLLAYISIAGEDRIAIWAIDPETGRLRFQEDIPIGGGPGPMATDPTGSLLYAGLRSSSQMASFRIAPSTGSLSPVGLIPLDAGPCFIATDRRGRFLLAAYYHAGCVSVHAIGPDGAVTHPPVEWLVTHPRAHSVQTDPSNRFAFVPHVMDSNVIRQFLFDEQTGSLRPNPVPRGVPTAGDGPRHFCFHPVREWVYVVNEQGCSVTAYRFDSAAGTLVSFQSLSTLPAGFTGENTCAEIRIAPSGRFLYASNRGHDSIACFAVDDALGRLTAIGQQPTETTPRAFAIDPHGRYLLAAGLGSGRLATYRINPQDGTLFPLATYEIGERPMWVLVLDLPRESSGLPH